MRFFYLTFLIFSFLSLSADSKFEPFIQEQINMVYQINDENVTQEKIMNITKAQEKLYSDVLDKILANKKEYLHAKNSHASEIFALQKIIKLNKRHSNKYAIIRDEVLIKEFVVFAFKANVESISRFLVLEHYSNIAAFLKNGRQKLTGRFIYALN